MTDKYADLREGMESFRRVAGELRGPEAQVADLLADYDRMREALETIAVYPHARDQEMSTAAMRKIARAAIAQKQGGSDANGNR